MSLKRCPDSSLNANDAPVLHHYRSKHQWKEFNDDLVDTTTEGIDQIERSEAWTRVITTFRSIEPIDQHALQMVVIEGWSLRQAALQLGDFGDDGSTARQTRPEQARQRIKGGSGRSLSITFHLFLECLDGGVEG